MATFSKDHPTEKEGWYWIKVENYLSYAGCKCWHLSVTLEALGCGAKIKVGHIIAVNEFDSADVNCLSCAIKNGCGQPPLKAFGLYFKWGEPEVLEKPKSKPSGPIKVVSFGLKFGPLDQTAFGGKVYILDVRKKVRNPWKDKSLRKLVGYDPKIMEFVSRCNGAQEILNYWEGNFKANGPSFYSNVAFSCHGGKHRSVAMAELLAARLNEAKIPVEVIHRDIQR